MTRPSPTRRRRRRGVALILVLGLSALFLSVVSLMALSSQVSRVNIAVSSARGDARYAAESGLAQTSWLILSQRQAESASLLPEPTVDPWQTGRGTQALQVGNVSVGYELTDAALGLAMVTPADLLDLRRLLAAPEATDGLVRDEDLIDVFGDYLDLDSLRRLHGRERGEYTDVNLPRNAVPRLRDEWLWVPEFATLRDRLQGPGSDVVSAEMLLRPIPPPGQPDLGAPAFSSAAPELLRRRATLDAVELEAVLAARRRSLETGQPLSETLGPLYARVAARFQMRDSGIYTVKITGGSPGGIQRRIEATVDLRVLPPEGARPITYWEYRVQ